MNLKQYCSLLSLSLLLITETACVSVQQRSIDPLPLPENFSVSGSREYNANWWQEFNDSGLNTVIDMALTSNFDLKIAQDRLEQAAALARKEGAYLYPSLDGTGGASSSRDREQGVSSSSQKYSLGLAASYEIDLWGRLRYARNSAELEAKASEADLQTAAVTVASEISGVWFELAENTQQIALARAQHELNQKVLQIISTQFRTGTAGFADVLQQKQLVESSNADLISLEANAKLLVNQLDALLGHSPGMVALPMPTVLPQLPPLPSTGIPADLLMNRPDFRSSFLALQSADQLAARAVANRYPKISIAADLSTGGASVSDLFNDWFSSLAANLAMPIFDGGELKAEADRTKAVASQRFHEYAQTVVNGLAEVEAAIIQENKQKKLLESYNSQLELAKLAVERIGDQYRQGVVDYERVLTALLSYQGLQKSVLQADRQMLTYRIQLYRTLGGFIDLDAVQKQSTVQEINDETS